jgi:hypothetical protein
LEIEHLEEAKRKHARIFIFGDFFDAMQGRFDPRRSMDELRPEYRVDNYYDVVVHDSAKFLAPYADLIDIISDGNHELAVRKNANTDLIDRLVYELRQDGKSSVVHGGYGGWVRMMVDKNSARESIKLKYFHGAGAEAPVTRGVIQTNRQAVYLPDADVVVNGHNHNAYYVPIARERISDQGKLFMSLQHHVRVPGYKQDYGDGTTGWSVTKGGVPKPIGAVWMRLWMSFEDQSRNHNGEVKMQFLPDVRGGDAVPCVDNIYSGKVYDEDQEGA